VSGRNTYVSRENEPITVVEGEARVAVRTDSGGTFREEAGFFGPGPQRLFGVLHRPTGPALGGLVICPSIYAEFITGYRTEVVLARTLASRGLAVQRFHYRGVGHSDGETEETTFATMREDALAAAARLLERTGVDGLGFLGMRFGGLVAGSAASEHRGCPLVLVEPTLEARRFFRDAWRAKLIRDVKRGTRAPGQGLAEALEREGTVDALGHSIFRPLFESTADRTLIGELGDGARPTLLVQLGRALSLRRDLEAAAAALRRLGCEVAVEAVAEDLVGWFLPDPGIKRTQPRARALIEVTSGWLEGEMGAAT
jgi:pimeloyl-ACP methyl ester carboxylesterase